MKCQGWGNHRATDRIGKYRKHERRIYQAPDAAGAEIAIVESDCYHADEVISGDESSRKVSSREIARWSRGVGFGREGGIKEG